MTTKLLKAEKVAEILDVSKQRVYELTRQKQIPFILVGDRQYRYSEIAISQWLENGGTLGQTEGENVGLDA
ncbi:MAG: helix-turn-helix domain-containing protein [Pyrinomonadaceae bacterium]